MSAFATRIRRSFGSVACLLFASAAHQAWSKGEEPAALQRTTVFDGFAANEVYPADINQDGRLELLCLQSPADFGSDIGWRLYVDKKNRSIEEKNIFCLTAITLEGKVIWQLGEPCLKFRCPTSHVADQMICFGLIADKTSPEVAVLKQDSLLILDPATGGIKRSTDLGADNYHIVRCVRTRQGNRLLVQNSDPGYPPYGYALPALICDAVSLRRIATVSDAVGSGHSPRAVDINGDGNDEILIGFEALDADGKRLWRLEGPHRQPTEGYHVDQLQIGRLGNAAVEAIVYAASGDVEAGALAGKRLWRRDFGHAQHVVLGNFRSGDKRACMAVYSCWVLGDAQKQFVKQFRVRVPEAKRIDAVAFVDEKGQIVNLAFPAIRCHSGEGMLVYPQGCPDGSDAVIVRDTDWPQALNMAGESPFVFKQPDASPQEKKQGPVGPGPDGYGVRIADFDNDGRAEVLIHDQTAAWIYKPPHPKRGAPNTHRRLEPITGQGWYSYP